MAVRTEDEFEVRRYEPYVVAELVVPGPADRAANVGFHVLADYLAGKNSARRSVAMSAPVIQTPVDASVGTSVPMIPSLADNGFLVQFIMPVGLALPDLPAPIDPRVRLRSLAAAKNWCSPFKTAFMPRLKRTPKNGVTILSSTRGALRA